MKSSGEGKENQTSNATFIKEGTPGKVWAKIVYRTVAYPGGGG